LDVGIPVVSGTSQDVVRADDEAWFTRVFTEHRADLLRFALRRVPRDSAADIVNETYLVAWRRRAELPRDHMRAWLFGVASNVIANSERGRVRAERLQERLATTAEPAVIDFEVRTTEGDAVLAALASLPEGEQESLRLIEWDNLSPSEAARVVGCTAATFRVRLHRARAHFSAAYTRLAGANR
jgi:RNA polymerase sigma-70 factor (ECF subfamily)